MRVRTRGLSEEPDPPEEPAVGAAHLVGSLRPGARSYLSPGLTPDMVDIRKVVTAEEVALAVGPVSLGRTEPPLHEPPAYLGPDIAYRWYVYLIQGGGTLTISLLEVPVDVARYPDFFVQANRDDPGRFVRMPNIGDDAYFDRVQGHLAVRVDRVEVAFHPWARQTPPVKALVALARAGVARLRQLAR